MRRVIITALPVLAATALLLAALAPSAGPAPGGPVGHDLAHEPDPSAMHESGMNEGEGTDSTRARNHPQPTNEELACVSQLTAEAKQLTARLADYDAAVAEGYHQPVKVGGTHHPNREYQRDGAVFDLARPESAIFRTRRDGSKMLIGVLYHAPVGEGPTPCGNATWWHTHSQCVDPSTRARLDPAPDGTCPLGMTLRESRIEMLHLWFVPRRALN